MEKVISDFMDSSSIHRINVLADAEKATSSIKELILYSFDVTRNLKKDYSLLHWNNWAHTVQLL